MRGSPSGQRDQCVQRLRAGRSRMLGDLKEERYGYNMIMTRRLEEMNLTDSQGLKHAVWTAMEGTGVYFMGLENPCKVSSWGMIRSLLSPSL